MVNVKRDQRRRLEEQRKSGKKKKKIDPYRRRTDFQVIGWEQVCKLDEEDAVFAEAIKKKTAEILGKGDDVYGEG